MKNKQYRLIVAAALLLFAVTGSKAQQAQTVSAPRTLSYQGILSSTGTPGNILGANRLLTVTLYGDANGTIKLWQSTMNTPIDSNGVFNCTLGTADNPLPQPSAMDRAIWLGVAVDNGTELRPLSQVTASAYAINVADSAITSQKIASGAVGTQSLADGSITTSKLADSSITSEKMNMDYVSSISVNGQPITGAGTNVNIVSGDGVNATWIPDESTLTLSGTGGASDGTTMSILTEWQLLGNTNIAVPLNFIGTKDDTSSALEIHLEDMSGGTATPDLVRVAHFQYETTSPNITLGYGAGSLSGNIIGNASTSVYHGSTIAGGGANDGWNSIGGNFDFIGSGTSQQIIGSNYSFLGSGDANTVQGNYSSIVGGASNYSTTDYDFIGGGYHNTEGANLDDTYIVIGGGYYNYVEEEYSSIVGGDTNQIHSPYGFIGGGKGNDILTEDEGASDARYSSIVGGYYDTIAGRYNFIGGGSLNHIYTDVFDSVFSSITGGKGNIIGGLGVEYGFIGGGYYNSVHGTASAIAGGDTNKIDTLADHSAIVGGQGNIIDTSATYSFIGGGRQNLVQGPWCVIAGGDSNSIYNLGADHNVIGGGLDNIEQNPSFGVIAGGWQNLIDTAAWGSGIGGGWADTVQPPLSFIGGGSQNKIEGLNWPDASAIVGGQHNHIYAGPFAFIGAGYENTITGSYSALGAGDSNNLFAVYGVLGGGFKNEISWGSDSTVLGGGAYNYIGQSFPILANYSALLGGLRDTIRSSNSFIGGGRDNQITSNAPNADIPGGDSLIANSYAQTVIGYNNVKTAIPVTKGTSHFWSPTNTIVDAPLLALGNGDNASSPSNAAEFSYDGHLQLYDVNGGTGLLTSPQPRQPYYGATYQDNTIMAWGDIEAGGNIKSDFGVEQVQMVHTGIYIVTVNIHPQDDPNPSDLISTFGDCTITATILDNRDTSDTTGLCGTITCSEFGAGGVANNQFIVRTYGPPAAESGCNVSGEEPFYFKVCARRYKTHDIMP